MLIPRCLYNLSGRRGFLQGALKNTHEPCSASVSRSACDSSRVLPKSLLFNFPDFYCFSADQTQLYKSLQVLANAGPRQA